MASILDYDFGSKLNKFVDKIPKFNLKGCFNNPETVSDTQSHTGPDDIMAEMQELSQRLTQAAIAIPTKQVYKVAKALSSVYPNDIGMKYLAVNLSTFPEEVLGYSSIEELRQSCLRQFPDSYAQEFFKRDIVRLAQNDMDVEFLTKVAATITSQSDFDNKIKQLRFEGSDVLNVDKRQFLLAHINESLNIEDTFPCDTVVKEEHLGYIKESHKKYMADVYKAEIAENLKNLIEKNAKFEIPEEIDFRGYEGAPLYFDVSTPEYQLILNLEGAVFPEFLHLLNASGTSLTYDSIKDVYVVSPYDNEVVASTYEIPEEIDFRTYTASMSLKVGSDRVEYHLLDNIWNDIEAKDIYCAEMKNAGVVVAYNEDDTYSIEKEQDNTIDAANEQAATLDIPEALNFVGYEGEPLYAGPETHEYQLLMNFTEDEFSEYQKLMDSGRVVVDYYPSDDVFEVRPKPIEYRKMKELEELGQHRLPGIANKKAANGYGSRIVQDMIDYYIKGYTSKENGGIADLIYQTYEREPGVDYAPELSELAMDNEVWLNNQDTITEDEVIDFEERFKAIVGDSPNYSYKQATKKADKIEKIWIVEKPKAESTIEDILFETTIGGLENQFKGGLSKNDIAATFTEEIEAREFAEKLLKERTSATKTTNKEAISVVDVRFPIDYNNIIKEEAREALDLHWDDSGYWVDTDGKAVTEDELYDIVERAYYYPSDVVSKTDKEGLSYGKLYKYFNEVAVPKKYKEMEELENLGQQRLPNIATKKAEENTHKLIIKSLDDVMAECSEGDWYFSRTGPATREEIKEEFEKHLKYKKADIIPTPVNMPEQEIYTRLTNETKDALSKIQSRAAELNTLRTEHLRVYAELDEAKDKLAEEKQRISAELSGYLDISGNSFTKICTALTVAETLEAQTEVILNAVSTSIDKVIEANEKAIPEDAKNILDILKHMGNVADDIVVEAKEELTKMTEGVSYVRHALRKKQATIDEGKFWPWIKTSIFGAKKFYGFADRNVNSFINDYGNLVKILCNY